MFDLPVQFDDRPSDRFEEWPAFSREFVRAAIARKSRQIGQDLSVMAVDISRRADGKFIGRAIIDAG